MNTVLQDLRYALRTLRKNPGFAAVAVLTLALGIGANTAIFSVVNAVLLRPLPFPSPDRLVMVLNHFPDLDEGPASFPDFQDWRKQNQVFDGMVALFRQNLNWIRKGEPERVRTGLVSEGLFSFFGLSPALGRPFTAAEHQAGAQPVCTLSYDFWQAYFGGRRDVIGQTLLLNGKGYSIVGVLPGSLPADFSYWKGVSVWTPLEANPPWNQPGTNYLFVAARLKPGATLSQARANMDVIQRGLNGQFPGNKHDVRVVSMMESLVSDTRPVLLVLLAAVGFILLIACANVANLTLARATGRTREFAIREALGSGRGRLMRQALTESVLLGGFGGAAGVLLAAWGVRFLVEMWPSSMPRLFAAKVDGPVLEFTAALSLIAGLLFGLIPAFQASRSGLNEALKETSQRSTEGGGRRRTRAALVVAETALACMLLVGAGLALKSFARLSRVDPGFNAENVLTLNISLPGRKYNEDSKISAFYRELLDRVRTLPGVQSAGAVTDLPLAGSTTGDFTIDGRPPFPEGQEPIAEKEIVTPGYFEIMQTPMIQGRSFSAEDGPDAAKVAIITESLARQFWPHQNPVGQHIDVGFGHHLPNGQRDWQQIIGVVHNVRFQSLDQPSGYGLYLCSLQYPASMALVVRTAGDPMQLASSVRKQVFAVDPEQPVYGVNSMDQIVADSVASRRAATFLMAAFAILATLLAAIGIYGVFSYSVSLRTHEVGIRMAFGARAADVLEMIAAQGLSLAIAGVTLGSLGALALTRFMTSLLYGVRPTDVATFFLAALLLTVVALAACYIPARRATKVDPMVALRYE
jgi:putative ABC transport system permease protein